MRRYKLVKADPDDAGRMLVRPDGVYVKFSEHKAESKRMREDVVRLDKYVDSLLAQLSEARAKVDDLLRDRQRTQTPHGRRMVVTYTRAPQPKLIGSGGDE
jgi:hypothetical protein